MVTFALDDEIPTQRYILRKQQFYFSDNSNLCLSLLDNKDKTSSSIYTYDNSLDKSESNDTEDNDRNDGDDNDIKDTKKEYKTQSSSKKNEEFELDEILDKVFEIYNNYKDIKKKHSEKMGKSEYLKNEAKILTGILKKEQEEKTILLKKLDNLAHIYKDRHIKVNPKETLHGLKIQYVNEVERIYGESQVESNKDYIKYVFLTIEIVCNYLGFDMAGYTKFNMDRISKYESILVEIGAIQTLVRLNTLHPVVKLGLLFTFNTLCFIGVKVAIKYDKSGGAIFNSVSNVFGSFLSSPIQNQGQNNVQKNIPQPPVSISNQPKMRGPRS